MCKLERHFLQSRTNMPTCICLAIYVYIPCSAPSLTYALAKFCWNLSVKTFYQSNGASLYILVEVATEGGKTKLVYHSHQLYYTRFMSYVFVCIGIFILSQKGCGNKMLNKHQQHNIHVRFVFLWSGKAEYGVTGSHSLAGKIYILSI